MRSAIIFVLYISTLIGAYFLGRSHSELKIVKEQVEVVKYVEKKKYDIYSKPNLGRDAIIKLMQSNSL